MESENEINQFRVHVETSLTAVRQDLHAELEKLKGSFNEHEVSEETEVGISRLRALIEGLGDIVGLPKTEAAPEPQSEPQQEEAHEE